MLKKTALTQFAIHDLIANRWSPLAFDANRPVTHEQILTLLEAARWAPSCNNAQPWRYLVFNKTTEVESWEKAFSCLAEGNQIWVKNAPVLLLATTHNFFTHNGQPNRWAQHDCGAANENICLQATSMGLWVHQMGGFDPQKAQELFGIPSDFTCMSMIAIGYQTDPQILEEKYQERELAERHRKPLEEVFFTGRWGTSNHSSSID
jgi:nitroreductase